MNRMVRWIGIAVPVVALSFANAFAQTTPPAAKPDAKPPVAKEEPKKEPAKDAKDILAVAKEAKLNTFIDLVNAAGLADTLKGAGPFHVFAPSDEAFAKLPNAADLKKPENKAKLADILKGHVVAKKADLMTEKTLKPVAGADIIVGKDGKVINDKINITKNLDASNGVIHVIDAVIVGGPTVKPAEMKPMDKPADKPADKPKTDEHKK